MKNFWKGLLGGVVVALILRVVLPVNLEFLFSLVVFVLLLVFTLDWAEKQKELISTSRKTFDLVAIVLCFIGLRVVTGYFFDMPVIQTYNKLDGIGIIGTSYKIIPYQLVLELLFILPGMAIAYKAIKGGKFSRGLIYLMSFLMFFVVLWQAKQEFHTQATRRLVQSTIDLQARDFHNKSLVKEGATASSYGIAKAKIMVFYRWDAESNTFLLDKEMMENRTISEGGKVLQARSDEKAKVYAGQSFTEIILSAKNGSFLNPEGDRRIWVLSTQFDWVNGGAVTDKSSITKSEDGKVWTVNFYTDEVVRILDNFKVGQTIIISGAPQGALKWPDIKNSATLVDVPQGIELKNLHQTGLFLKCEAGRSVTIKFL